jgi:DNA-binding XRE family transcriptional regulator
MISTELRAHLRKVNGKGCRTLEDIRLRCRVDEVSGCWLWSLCFDDNKTPKVGIPAGVLGEREATMSAAKASWLLSGRKLAEGHVVWRSVCGDSRCVNPQHCTALPRAEMRRKCGESNREKGNVKRTAANVATATKLAVKPDVVKVIEARLKRGEKQRDIAADVAVSRDTVHRISSGKHMFSAGRVQPLLRASSVFTWGRPE